jgi:hypothetical protein
MAHSDPRAELARLEQGCSVTEALALYDTLPPVDVDVMVGAWRGAGIPTGGPFDGLLENLGWHGKRFESTESVHPLVFAGARGRLVSVDPGRVPLGLAARHGQRFTGRATAIAFRMLLPLLATRRPRARLRPVTYRGLASAAMVYDQLPIIDAFRAVDPDTVVGAMDLRGLPEPYLFTLRRERPASAP